MIKKIILISLVMATTNSYAAYDFVKNCPAPNRIQVVKFSFYTNSYLMQATNYEGKEFRSQPIPYANRHLTVHPLMLMKERSKYDATRKELTCDYLAIDTGFTHVKLSNVGDY